MKSRVVYGWSSGRSFKVSAQIVGEELERIEKEAGEVSPRLLVGHAKPVSSPLHSFFEWDDRIAAEEYRVEQARSLIQAVVVKAFDGAETRNPIRAFVNVGTQDGRGYFGIATVMSDEEKREQLIMQARAEIEQWRDRYRAIVEFSKVFEAIDKIAAKEPPRRRTRKSTASVSEIGRAHV